MKWAPDNTPVGFDLEANEEKENAGLVKEARNLFLIIGVFLGILIPGIISFKEGALNEHLVTLKQPGTLARLNPSWDAEPVGSISVEGKIFPTTKAIDGEVVDLAVKKEEEPPKKAHGDHGKAHEKDEAKEAEAPKEAPAPVKYTVKGEWYQVTENGRLFENAQAGDEASITGWVPAETVEVQPAGFAGALMRRGSLLKTLWTLAFISWVIALAAAKAMVPFVKKWMQYVVAPMGWFNTRVLLTIIFFVAISPMALFFKYWLGKDTLELKIDKDRKSYWGDKRSLERDHFNHIF
ncbi:MAG: hypothetical protein P1V97_12625 [Planctomycetota bacterium]|nr:hypothetical protein [Planctomycetota bacterium]